MVITTGSAAARITPVVVKTFFSHYYKRARRSSKDRNVQAIDELIYDEAFHIVQKFCELATHDTVEAIQNFTNTQIPTPPWALSIPVMVPLSSCHQAAEALIKYFGPEELETIVGGEKWWQVRPQAGVPAEWIAQRDDWAMYQQEKHKHQPSVNSDGEHVFEEDENESVQSSSKGRGSRRPTKQQKRHQRMKAAADEQDTSEDINRLKRVMLYIHGGAYYWGSINTHRHQIIRFARKFGGRALAVNYRKAPDYPWPAPLHDCLSAYMYLIRPPPGAPHPPIDPKKLVIAGDSAGGGLCLALLGVLRDTGIPMPAGAVLISPWCDMTHSFPSILQNTATDIVPPYGFIHKPSPLWPIPATVPEGGPKDKNDENAEAPELSAPQGVDSGNNTETSTHDVAVAQVEDRGKKDGTKDISKAAALEQKTLKPKSSRFFRSLRGRKKEDAEGDEEVPIPPTPKWLYSPPIKVPVSEEAIKKASEGKNNDPSAKVDFTKEVELKERAEDGKRMGTFELCRQIQQYAANKQVFHPLCSPVMQGSLGGFPPLYILAGDGEVLRDEIIYLAHRAAHPKKYPLGEHLMTPRAREAASKYDETPTKVHFQLYDDQCHVLTVFAFTTQAKYAFRAIASFVKHVTGAKTSVLDAPFPRVLDGDIIHSPGERAEEESLATLDSNNPPSEIGREPDSGDATQETVVAEGDSLNDQAEPELAALPEDEPLETSQSSINGPPNSRANGKPSLSVVTADNGAQSNQNGSNDIGPDGNRKFPDVPYTTSAQDMLKTPVSALSPRQQRVRDEKERKHTLRERKQKLMNISQPNEYDGQVPLMRPQYREFMIRERVDIRGQIRGMEKEVQMPALQLKPDEIGVIKEGPCLRYMAGQTIWDRKFKRTVKKVERIRVENEHKAAGILRKAVKQGLLVEGTAIKNDSGKLSEWEQWLASVGPTTILKESPPPSAIVGRRDTAESIQLLLLCLRARAKALDIQNAHLSGHHSRSRGSKSHRRSQSRNRHGHRRSGSHAHKSDATVAGGPSSAGTAAGPDGEDGFESDPDSESMSEDEGPRLAQEGGRSHGLSAWNTVMSSLYRARTTPKERREVKLKQRKSPAASRQTSVAYQDQDDDDAEDQENDTYEDAQDQGPSEPDQSRGLTGQSFVESPVADNHAKGTGA